MKKRKKNLSNHIPVYLRFQPEKKAEIRVEFALFLRFFASQGALPQVVPPKTLP
jgi:hypothetical protein